MAARGLLPDKTVVFGHWHTSWPRYKYNNEPEFDYENLPTNSYEKYSNLDYLGRAGVAIANISKDVMPTEERGSIG